MNNREDIRYWLKNSNKTVKEIADMLEFPNLSFFGKYCRTRFGLSPTEYRRQLRSHPPEEEGGEKGTADEPRPVVART